jgi:polysaccharide deacetylase family protein (PEP-CTERM system associated)
MLNALTIDLEDWFQGLTSTSQKYPSWEGYESRVVANTERLLEMLAGARVTATFFVLGYVADHFPELVRAVTQAGHEIGLHSYAHRRVCSLTPDQFREDLIRGREAVQKACGRQVIGYRAPMFSIEGSSLWALEILCENGFHYDSSVFPTRNLWYGYPGAPRFPYQPLAGRRFLEFPVSTVRCLGLTLPVAGGFYARTIPYPLLAMALRRIHREGKPAILYLHPWELDTHQHYSHVTPRERITHYFGRLSLPAKLNRLLADFEFVPLRDIAECARI